MTGRDDLDELHALAASISEETHGWRAHRRQRSLAAAQARNEAMLVAPVKRRRKHRWIAAGAVGVVVLVGVSLVAVFWPKAHRAPRPHVPPVAHVASYVRAGHRAAAELTSQGRIPNIFSCQSLYNSARSTIAPQHQTQAWRTGYLTACSNVVATDSNSG